MIPVESFEIAKNQKRIGSFNADKYIMERHPEYAHFENKLVLKVGQKVIVLNNDEEYEKRFEVDFQTKRLYVIIQFSESIWLKYHLEAQAKSSIDDSVKDEKDKLLLQFETYHGIPEVVENTTIEDNKARKEEYEKKKYSFDNLSRFRFQRLIDTIGFDKTKEIKKELDKFKTQSSFIEVEGKTPLLKMSKENWNFLYEGYDFKISMLGEITWIK